MLLWAIAESHGKVGLTQVWPLCAGDKEGGPSDGRLFVRLVGVSRGMTGAITNQRRRRHLHDSGLDRLLVL